LGRIFFVASEYIRFWAIAKSNFVDIHQRSKRYQPHQRIVGQQIQALLESVPEMHKLVFVEARVDNKEKSWRTRWGLSL
jgi:hypothetical protein